MGNNRYLYHYTTLENFQKIITSNSFILSSFSSANDYKEKVAREFKSDNIENYRYMSTVYDIDERGISTLSFSNSMMWYFYGDKGNGVCIEFNQGSLIQTSPTVARQVIYRDGVTHIDCQDIEDYLMEKKTCWAGENEFRLLYRKEIERISNILDHISGVYLGDKVSTEIAEELEKKFSFSIYKMFIDKEDGRYNRIKHNGKVSI